MILKYGNYDHADNECQLLIGSQIERTDAGLRKKLIKTYLIRGQLQGSSPAELTSKIQALEAAYAQDYQDLKLYLSDNATLSAHLLQQAASLTGVRVVDGVKYPVGDGAQYTTFRDYEITVEADFATTSVAILAWVETLTFVGTGGPMTVHIPTAFGAAQKQITSQTTPVQVIQSGSAVGWTAYPFAPAPLWPAAEVLPRRRIAPTSPKRMGDSFVEFGLTWSYEFEAAVPLNGLPTPQPNL